MGLLEFVVLNVFCLFDFGAELEVGCCDVLMILRVWWIGALDLPFWVGRVWVSVFVDALVLSFCSRGCLFAWWGWVWWMLFC